MSGIQLGEAVSTIGEVIEYSNDQEHDVLLYLKTHLKKTEAISLASLDQHDITPQKILRKKITVSGIFEKVITDPTGRAIPLIRATKLTVA